MVVAGKTDEDTLFIGGLERLVDRPGADPARHRRLRHVGYRAADEMLHHQESRRFEQGALHELPFAGALPVAQRRLDADDGKGAPHDVDDGGSGAKRAARRSGHVGETGHVLHHLVQSRPVLVRAAEESLEGAEDYPWIDLLAVLIAAAQFFHRTRRVILDHHVGGPDQAMHRGAALVAFKVRGEPALVTVESAEESGGKAVQAPGLVAVRRGLDLDYVRAEIG